MPPWPAATLRAALCMCKYECVCVRGVRSCVCDCMNVFVSVVYAFVFVIV